METRLIVAYVLLVLLACALAVGLSRLLTRDRRRHRRHMADKERMRASAPGADR